MVLETVYVVRHGFRMSWSVDPYTVKYHSHIPTPTGLPADPALSSYGEKQAEQLGIKLATSLDPPISQVISSPYYRCLQTLKPGVLNLIGKGYEGGVLLESGFEEWYGETGDHREQPSPYSYEGLRDEFFDDMGLHWDDGGRGTVIKPNQFGESIEGLHNRIAYALHRTIERADKAGWRAVVICTHAAAMIAIGRVLTGRMPENIEEEDFHCFTASLSQYNRKDLQSQPEAVELWGPKTPEMIPKINWRDGRGVTGGWKSVLNGDCSFLENGAERGWHFSGDESFLSVERVNETVPEELEDERKEELNMNRALCVAVAAAEDDDEKEKSKL